MKISRTELDKKLLQLASRHLNISTLETRNSDGLDFYDRSVWNIKAALEAAYQLGQRDAAVGQ